MEDLEALKEELKGLHHSTNRAKEIKKILATVEETSAPETSSSQEDSQLLEETPEEQVKVPEPYEFKINPNKTYRFVTDKHKGVWMVPREAIVWDEETDSQRVIRYNRLAESPFEDEQPEWMKADRESPTFRGGFLNVSGKNPALIRYLMAFDGFADKKTIAPSNRYFKGSYYLDDPEEKLRQQADRDDRILAARNIVSKAIKSNEKELEDFIRSEFGFREANPTADRLKTFANKMADNYPDKFIKDFKNPKHKIKSDILRAYEKGVFIISDGHVVIKDTRQSVLALAKNAEFEKVLTDWVIAGSPQALDFKHLVDKGI